MGLLMKLGGIVTVLFGIVFTLAGAYGLAGGTGITFTINERVVSAQEGGIVFLIVGIIMLLGGIAMTYVARAARLMPERPERGEWAARWADLKYTLHLLRKNPLVMAGSMIAIFFVALSLLANLIVDPNLAVPTGYPEFEHSYPFERKFMWPKDSVINWGPGVRLYEGPEQFYLGTDNWGRDLLKMIILAIPVDVENAVIVTVLAATFGTLIGALAGYVGGVVEEAVLRITDIFFAFPALVLALVFAAMFGRTLPTLRLALLLVWWPPYVRLMRGQILSEKQKGYVEALRGLGAGHLRILFRHIIPNSIYPILVQATLDFGGVILTFSALMFLGFSPSPSLPELGNLAASGYEHIFEAPWLIIFPGLTMLIIALAFNLVGDGLRDVLDPKLRR